ncbi:MAG: hypothetical protein CMJ58_28730 [Planctomycetaceae bacterium]|nr:hypothetical protein [Planctomycetaceae bacterium]
MAWLEQRPSGAYHIVFRLDGTRFSRSLKTKSHKEALARRLRVEENLKLIETGRLSAPADADLVTFLLSDGKLNHLPAPQKRIRLGKLFQAYEDSLPVGALEANSLRIAAIHMRHVARTLGKNLSLRETSTEHLQRHVNIRAEEPGKFGRTVSATTIRKELATFRAIWNWAVEHDYVSTPFPSRGVRYPKHDEKPPFRTRDEIFRLLNVNSADGCSHDELWQGLYLTADDLAAVLDTVREKPRYEFLYPMTAMAAYTGARLSELCRSQACDIDMQQGSILIREKKRQKGRRTYRHVPIADPLRDVLGRWLQQRSSSQYTFPSEWKVSRTRKAREEQGAVSPEEARHHLDQALAKTPWSMIPGWHVFRHSFISICASKGIDQRMIDDWVGHQTDEQRKRYRHLFPEVQRQALQSVF